MRTPVLLAALLISLGTAACGAQPAADDSAPAADHMASPDAADHMASPDAGDHMASPEAGDHMASPDAGDHMASPGERPATMDPGGHGEGHGPSTTVPPVPGATGVRVVASELAYTPERLDLSAGEPVNLTVVNEGQLFHDFTIEVAGIHLNVNPGEEVTTALVIDEPGTYEAICTVAGHAEAGMVFTIRVS
jgi:heme/copper-type cytochrome/quinol oxidase subunit 2